MLTELGKLQDGKGKIRYDFSRRGAERWCCWSPLHRIGAISVIADLNAHARKWRASSCDWEADLAEVKQVPEDQFLKICWFDLGCENQNVPPRWD
jgi:hypothetical protein